MSVRLATLAGAALVFLPAIAAAAGTPTATATPENRLQAPGYGLQQPRGEPSRQADPTPLLKPEAGSPEPASPTPTPGGADGGAPAEPAALPATPTGLPAAKPEARVLQPEPGDPFAVGVWPARPFQGSLLVVDVAAASGKRVKGTFQGKTLRWHKLDRVTWRGLAPVPDDAKAGDGELALEIELKAPPRKKGEKAEPAPAPAKRTWTLPVEPVGFDQDQLKVDRKYTKIPPEAQEKIKADKELLNAMWKKGSAWQPFFRKNFQKPRDDRTTAPYGTRRVFNGKTKSVHYGWDIDGNVGDELRCDNDGVVMMASELYYSGGTLFIDHGGGLYTCYFHMSEFAVAEGDTVKRGQVCGKVGKSGRVTGPHLHWCAKLGGSYIHPETLLLFDFEKPLVTPPLAAPPAEPPGGAP